MSADISGKPVRPKRVRYVREERGGEEVNVVHIDEGADSHRDQGSGSQEATRDPGVQRELIIHRHIFIAAAVCLSLLCVLMVVRTTHMAMDYNSDNAELLINNLTERNDLLNNFNQLMQANKQLESEVINLKREKADDETKYNDLVLKKNQLEGEVNQLKKAVKECPSGWEKFGWSCYYRSTGWQTWEKSRELCQNAGADLLVINSKEEQEFIRGLNNWIGTSWLGLIQVDGNWFWVDEAPLTTWYWAIGYPQGHGTCAEYWHGTGQGSNALCSEYKYGICEK